MSIQSNTEVHSNCIDMNLESFETRVLRESRLCFLSINGILNPLGRDSLINSVSIFQKLKKGIDLVCYFFYRQCGVVHSVF